MTLLNATLSALSDPYPNRGRPPLGGRRHHGHALNPGYILTGLQRHLDDDTMRAFGVMDEQGNLTPLPYYKTPAQGAATTSVLLAASPLLQGVTGRYFEDNQEARTVGPDEPPTDGVATHALDPETADHLWQYATTALQRSSSRPSRRSWRPGSRPGNVDRLARWSLYGACRQGLDARMADCPLVRGGRVRRQPVRLDGPAFR